MGVVHHAAAVHDVVQKLTFVHITCLRPREAPLPLSPAVHVFPFVDITVGERKDALPMLHVALPVAHVLLSIGGEEGFTLAMFFSFRKFALVKIAVGPGELALAVVLAVPVALALVVLPRRLEQPRDGVGSVAVLVLLIQGAEVQLQLADVAVDGQQQQDVAVAVHRRAVGEAVAHPDHGLWGERSERRVYVGGADVGGIG